MTTHLLPASNAHLQLRELRGALEQGEPLLAVHYGCEDFYNAKGPAAVACIALADVEAGSSVAFSQSDPPPDVDGSDREIDVLTKFYAYLQARPDVRLLHWNMNNSAYGFAALANRYRYLTNTDPTYQPASDRVFDIDNLIAQEFGADYARHPKLPACAALNGLSKRFLLAGPEEAARFASGDLGAVRASVAEKARIIGELFVRLARGVLITQSSVGSVAFAGANLDAVKTVLALADRIVYVQRALSRRRKPKAPLELTDEYDDQYLLGALLRIFFDDVRAEAGAQDHAGAAPRIDFLIPRFRLALELKHARASMTDKSLADELITDRERYGASGEVNHLLCLVFDHDGHLLNPRGLEQDLSKAHSVEGLAVTVRIFDR